MNKEIAKKWVEALRSGKLNDVYGADFARIADVIEENVEAL